MSDIVSLAVNLLGGLVIGILLTLAALYYYNEQAALKKLEQKGIYKRGGVYILTMDSYMTTFIELVKAGKTKFVIEHQYSKTSKAKTIGALVIEKSTVLIYLIDPGTLVEISFEYEVNAKQFAEAFHSYMYYLGSRCNDNVSFLFYLAGFSYSDPKDPESPAEYWEEAMSTKSFLGASRSASSKNLKEIKKIMGISL